MSTGPSPNSIASGPTPSPSASSKRDRSNTAEDSAAPAYADRLQKRTRVRQACNRCKARKIKCGDLRPCKNCTSLGLVCRDWRPGEDPNDASFAHPAGSSSSVVTERFLEGGTSVEYKPRSYEEPRHVLSDAHYERAGRHTDTASRAERSGSAIPWPNTPYERSRHSVHWPPKPDPTRHRYLAYPYVSAS